MDEVKILRSCCQIRKKTNATGTKSSVIAIGCLVTLPASGLLHQDRLCVLSRYLKLPQISLSRDCFVVFSKDKRIQLKPDRYLESSPQLGFTLVACEQAKLLRDDYLKPLPLKNKHPAPGDTFTSVKLSSSKYTTNMYEITELTYSNIFYSTSPVQGTILKGSSGGPLFSEDGELIGISKSGVKVGTGLCVSAILHHINGFKESDHTEEILEQLYLLEQDDISIDKERLKISACQALSKRIAKSVEEVEQLVAHPSFNTVLMGTTTDNMALIGATCKLLTIISSPQTLTHQTRGISFDMITYVLNAMNTSQHATVHLFGCRVLLNLVTCLGSDQWLQDQQEDIRTVILDNDGIGVLRRVIRCHRDDKHIQHTVCLILSLLLEYTYKGWRESEEHRDCCISELEAARDLLSTSQVHLDGEGEGEGEGEAVILTLRLEEQDKILRQQNKVIENRDCTIEQLHRRLEHAIVPADNSDLEHEVSKLREERDKERELWVSRQVELEQSLDFSQELVRDMTSALRQVKVELEAGCESRDENKKQEYRNWNNIKEELERITRAVTSLGGVAEKELMYHYDMVEVGREEDLQLQKTMENVAVTPVEKHEVLRRFERTHSQSSLDISMDTEQKATKTLDKLQMLRRAIHGLEQGLENQEERLEKLRQRRFINPLQDISEASSKTITSAQDIDIHNLPRGLHKHMCRMLDEAPNCGWRKVTPLLGLSHRIRDIESSLDSPSGELLRIWTNENRLVTFTDFLEVLRLADQHDVIEFAKRHLHLKKRLSKQSFLYIPIDQVPSTDPS